MHLGADLTLDFADRTVTTHARDRADWKVTLVDTGVETTTGTRVARVAHHIADEEFLLTWCDTLADIDLNRLVAFHKDHKKLATLTAVHRRDRFGVVSLDEDTVTAFSEKPLRTDEWINGAFFVLRREIFDLLQGEAVDWETDLLSLLAQRGQLQAYRHHGYWQCMDSPGDREILERAVLSGHL